MITIFTISCIVSLFFLLVYSCLENHKLAEQLNHALHTSELRKKQLTELRRLHSEERAAYKLEIFQLKNKI